MNSPILLIEDDEPLGAMIAQYLRERDFDVTHHVTGKAGMDALAARNFDAVLLDVMLPDADGFHLCRDIRAKSEIPILMLTARGEETDRIVGLELGADDYLPKPFNPRELLARLRAILRRGTNRDADRGRFRFGRLEIDTDQRQVRLDGDAKSLTAHQFDLLLVLAQNPGRVMSRDALMNAMRGENLEAFDRSIDVHISRIRNAIEDDPRNPRRILTVRGAGYVFARAQDADAER